jgi:hypothetical protein
MSTVKKDDSLAVGSPTAAILEEIFIQHLKHTYIMNILKKHIINYFRYVDDMLTIYIIDTNTENALKFIILI